MVVKRSALVLFLGILIGAALSLTHGVLAERDQGFELGGDQQHQLPLDRLRTFSEIFSRVKSSYVEEVGDDELLDGAIRGMLSNLDPHSAYLDEEDFQALQEGTSGEFGGLGIEVGMEDGFVKVIAPIDGTPAQRAGIESGDLIVRLDSTPVKGMSLSDAVDKMRGEPGTEIELTVVRDGVDQPMKITIERAVIQVDSVTSRIVEDDYGYIRIRTFQGRTGKDVEKAVNELKDEVDGELRGVVLDMRNNPGGVLNAAVEVSNAFLDGGNIVYTEGQVDEARMSFDAEPGDMLDGAPMVALINGGSASASEIVAGALQDHGRAVIMGAKSFGKGSVQTVFPLGGSTAVKLTTARYYTPEGRSIQAKGIEPDVQLGNFTLSAAEKERQGVREADLARHLENGGESVEQAPEDIEEEDFATSDYPVFEALNLLKGMQILKQRD
ncbi:MAG: S41 family peptidase [Pseudomonadota bacterium]